LGLTTAPRLLPDLRSGLDDNVVQVEVGASITDFNQACQRSCLSKGNLLCLNTAQDLKVLPIASDESTADEASELGSVSSEEDFSASDREPGTDWGPQYCCA